jgi:4-hydroxybutyrate dehydrogenase/sulfolactaldehyde 3-reductase
MGPDVEAVALGSNGIVLGAHPGLIHIDMSTIDPGVTRRIADGLAAKGVRMVDAAVGKGVDAAVAGTLTLMLGGDPAVIDQVRPVLNCMGREFFYCGPSGMGATMKLTNNLLAGAILVASAEAVTLGVKAGLSLETILEVMRTTAAANWALLEAFPKRAFRGNTVPAGFMLRLADKDVHLALGMAERHDVEAPVGAATSTVLQRAIAENLGREDITAVLKLNERQAGVRVRTDNLVP